MSVVYGVYGKSGFGREVMPLLERQAEKVQREEAWELYFIDDAHHGETANGIPVVDFESFLKIPGSGHQVSIAVADGGIRQRLTEKCEQAGVEMIGVHAENIVILSEVTMGGAEILCPFVTLTSNVKIGKSFHANLYSYVAHDCVIGDYVTFAPAVRCNGNVVVEDHAYIGTGAIIKQGKPGRPIRIGKGAVVSAGAFVTKNVPEGMTVFGNPAVEMTKENLRRRNG